MGCKGGKHAQHAASPVPVREVVVDVAVPSQPAYAAPAPAPVPAYQPPPAPRPPSAKTDRAMPAPAQRPPSAARPPSAGNAPSAVPTPAPALARPRSAGQAAKPAAASRRQQAPEAYAAGPPIWGEWALEEARAAVAEWRRGGSERERQSAGREIREWTARGRGGWRLAKAAGELGEDADGLATLLERACDEQERWSFERALHLTPTQAFWRAAWEAREMWDDCVSFGQRFARADDLGEELQAALQACSRRAMEAMQQSDASFERARVAAMNEGRSGLALERVPGWMKGVCAVEDLFVAAAVAAEREALLAEAGPPPTASPPTSPSPPTPSAATTKSCPPPSAPTRPQTARSAPLFARGGGAGVTGAQGAGAGGSEAGRAWEVQRGALFGRVPGLEQLAQAFARRERRLRNEPPQRNQRPSDAHVAAALTARLAAYARAYPPGAAWAPGFNPATGFIEGSHNEAYETRRGQKGAGRLVGEAKAWWAPVIRDWDDEIPAEQRAVLENRPFAWLEVAAQVLEGKAALLRAENAKPQPENWHGVPGCRNTVDCLPVRNEYEDRWALRELSLRGADRFQVSRAQNEVAEEALRVRAGGLRELHRRLLAEQAALSAPDAPDGAPRAQQLALQVPPPAQGAKRLDELAGVPPAGEFGSAHRPRGRAEGDGYGEEEDVILAERLLEQQHQTAAMVSAAHAEVEETLWRNYNDARAQFLQAMNGAMEQMRAAGTLEQYRAMYEGQIAQFLENLDQQYSTTPAWPRIAAAKEAAARAGAGRPHSGSGQRPPSAGTGGAKAKDLKIGLEAGMRKGGGWLTLHVFVSSTFRDMHGERDVLTRVTFPALNDRCRACRVTVVPIDLRWGLTEEDTGEGGKGALEICLEEIDRARPFFVYLGGERYGWVPPAYRLSREARFERVRALPAGRSITACEVEYGFLQRPDEPVHAYAYFRDPAFLASIPHPDAALAQVFEAESPEHAAKQVELRRAIGAHPYCVVRSYGASWRGLVENKPMVGGLEGLAEAVLGDLWAAVEREFPPRAALPAPAPADKEEGDAAAAAERVSLVAEAAAHEALESSRGERVLGREETLQAMLDFVRNSEQPLLLVRAQPGFGKSAVAARFVRLCREQFPEAVVVAHFVGASPASTRVPHLVRRLAAELIKAAARLGRPCGHARVPAAYLHAKARLAEVLREVCEGGFWEARAIVVVDAVNQLEAAEGRPALDWLPWLLPRGLRLVLTAADGFEASNGLDRREPPPALLDVPALPAPERRAILEASLAVYGKKLAPGQVEQLLAKPGAASPLYLTGAVEELRVFGVFERLSERIAQLPAGVAALFEQTLARVEADQGAERVRDALSLVLLSGERLAAPELLELLAEGDLPRLPWATWARLRDALQAYLRPAVGPDSALGFFHRQLARAIRARYLTPCPHAPRCAPFERGDPCEHVAPRPGEEPPRGWAERDGVYHQRLARYHLAVAGWPLEADPRAGSWRGPAAAGRGARGGGGAGRAGAGPPGGGDRAPQERRGARGGGGGEGGEEAVLRLLAEACPSAEVAAEARALLRAPPPPPASAPSAGGPFLPRRGRGGGGGDRGGEAAAAARPEGRPGEGCRVRELLYSPSSALVATCGEDGVLRLWSARTGASAGTFDAHERELQGMDWVASGGAGAGQRAVLAVQGTALKVYDLEAAQAVYAWDVDGASSSSVLRGVRVQGAGEPRAVLLVRDNDLLLYRRPDAGPAAGPADAASLRFELALSVPGHRVAVRDDFRYAVALPRRRADRATLWALEPGLPVAEAPAELVAEENDHGSYANHYAALVDADWQPRGDPAGPPGALVAVLRLDGAVQLHDARLGLAEVARLPAPQGAGAGVCVRWVPPGDLLAAAYEDRSVRLLRLDGQPLALLAGLRRSLASLAVAPSAASLAAADAAGSLRLWTRSDALAAAGDPRGLYDAGTGQLRASFRGGRRPVELLALAPAAAGAQEAALLEVAGREIPELEGCTLRVWRVTAGGAQLAATREERERVVAAAWTERALLLLYHSGALLELPHPPRGGTLLESYWAEAPLFRRMGGRDVAGSPLRVVAAGGTGTAVLRGVVTREGRYALLAQGASLSAVDTRDPGNPRALDTAGLHSASAQATCCAAAANGRLAAIGFEDGHLAVYDLASGERVAGAPDAAARVPFTAVCAWPAAAQGAPPALVAGDALGRLAPLAPSDFRY
eukprot:tig00021537_g22266.t1